jgi:hypothetical protein
MHNELLSSDMAGDARFTQVSFIEDNWFLGRIGDQSFDSKATLK